jgi:hypothetical protein
VEEEKGRMIKLKELLKEWTDNSFRDLPKRWSKPVMKGRESDGLTEFERKFGEPLTEAKKSDVKKMEKMADKIVADMNKLNKMFAKHHTSKGSINSNPTAYRTLKDWEQVRRDTYYKYGGWFEYVYDSDNVE